MGEQHIGILIGPIPPNGQQPPPIPLKVFPKKLTFYSSVKNFKIGISKNIYLLLIDISEKLL